MKKQILALIILFSFASIMQAQAPLQFDRTQVNAGFGLTGWGLPVYLGIDYGFADNVSVGGEVFYSTYRESYFGYDWRHSVVTIAGNGNYHFNELLEIPSVYDVYAGLSLGYAIFNTTFDEKGTGIDYDGSANSGLFLVGQIGGRYFFSERLAGQIQIGVGSTYGARVGITYLL